MQRLITRIVREQRGSAVTQAAGIAILVAVLVMAMLNMLGWLQSGLTDSLRCYVAGFDIGGCGATAPGFDRHIVAAHLLALAQLTGLL